MVKTFLAIKSIDGQAISKECSVMTQQYTWRTKRLSLPSGLLHILPPRVSVSSESWQPLTPGQPYHPSGGQRRTSSRFWHLASVRTVAGWVPVWLVCSRLIPRLWTRLMLNACAMTHVFTHHITVGMLEHWKHVLECCMGKWWLADKARSIDCSEVVTVQLSLPSKDVWLINIRHIWTLSTLS